MAPACITRVGKTAWRTERPGLLCRVCGAGIANINRPLSRNVALLPPRTASIDSVCVVDASRGVNCQRIYIYWMKVEKLVGFVQTLTRKQHTAQRPEST